MEAGPRAELPTQSRATRVCVQVHPLIPPPRETVLGIISEGQAFPL